MRRALFTLLLSVPLWGATSAPLQEMRLSLEQFKYQLHAHESELLIFQERLSELERTLELNRSSASGASESRIAALEKTQQALFKDFKTLKSELSQTSSTLARLDKQLSQDVKGLKKNLESIIGMLQLESSGGEYVVQSGDSLGKIAIDHKTTTQEIKKLNNLSKDTIFPGQKLRLP